MSTSLHATSGYRRDIDGLRAVAILGVIIFHAFPTLLTGGFIGVDIFFVISGFLISGIVFREQERGQFSFRDFYARRIKRIFPALLVMLAVCLVAAWFLMFPDEYELLGGHTLKGLLFVQNISLSHKVGYFGARAQLAPLLHLWSLCVEEQFYLIWPVLVILVMKRIPQLMMPIIVGLIILSFGINMMTVETDPLQAFFLPMQRFWELLAGALLAFVASKRNLQFNPHIGTTVATIGLALIITGFIFVNETQSFPGWRAIAPVLGAFLLIAAGPQTAINRWVLGNPVMVFIGLISYPLYIWHWPILTFMRITQGEAFSTFMAAAGLVAAFILAVATYIGLEKKVRFIWPTRRTVPALIAVAVILCGLGALAQSHIIPTRLELAGGKLLVEAQKDWHSLESLNFKHRSDFSLYEIKGGTDRAVLVIGDSHAEQYVPWFENKYNGDKKKLPTALFAVNAGCAPLPGLNQIEDGYGCDAFFDFAMDVARRDTVKTIVINAYWESYVGLSKSVSTDNKNALYAVNDSARSIVTNDSSALQDSLGRLTNDLKNLKKQGKRIYIILSNPVDPAFDPRTMINRFNLKTGPDTIAQQDFVQRINPIIQRLREVARKSGAIIIDPVDFMCDGTICPTRMPDGRPAYKDSNHMRTLYAIEKGDFLNVVLEP